MANNPDKFSVSQLPTPCGRTSHDDGKPDACSWYGWFGAGTTLVFYSDRVAEGQGPLREGGLVGIRLLRRGKYLGEPGGFYRFPPSGSYVRGDGSDFPAHRLYTGAVSK